MSELKFSGMNFAFKRHLQQKKKIAVMKQTHAEHTQIKPFQCIPHKYRTEMLSSAIKGENPV